MTDMTLEAVWGGAMAMGGAAAQYRATRTTETAYEDEECLLPRNVETLHKIGNTATQVRQAQWRWARDSGRAVLPVCGVLVGYIAVARSVTEAGYTVAGMAFMALVAGVVSMVHASALGQCAIRSCISTKQVQHVAVDATVAAASFVAALGIFAVWAVPRDKLLSFALGCGSIACWASIDLGNLAYGTPVASALIKDGVYASKTSISSNSIHETAAVAIRSTLVSMVAVTLWIGGIAACAHADTTAFHVEEVRLVSMAFASVIPLFHFFYTLFPLTTAAVVACVLPVTFTLLFASHALLICTAVAIAIVLSLLPLVVPVTDLVDSCSTGTATSVIFGLAFGYRSTVLPTAAFAGLLLLARTDTLIATACGFIALLPATLVLASLAPIVHAATRIAQQCHVDPPEHDPVLDAALRVASSLHIHATLLVALVLASSLAHTQTSLMEIALFSGLLVGFMVPYWITALVLQRTADTVVAAIEEAQDGAVAPSSHCWSEYTVLLGLPLLMRIDVFVADGFALGCVVASYHLALSHYSSGDGWDAAARVTQHNDPAIAHAGSTTRHIGRLTSSAVAPLLLLSLLVPLLAL